MHSNQEADVVLPGPESSRVPDRDGYIEREREERERERDGYIERERENNKYTGADVRFNH